MENCKLQIATRFRKKQQQKKHSSNESVRLHLKIHFVAGIKLLKFFVMRRLENILGSPVVCFWLIVININSNLGFQFIAKHVSNVSKRALRRSSQLFHSIRSNGSEFMMGKLFFRLPKRSYTVHIYSTFV